MAQLNDLIVKGKLKVYGTTYAPTFKMLNTSGTWTNLTQSPSTSVTSTTIFANLSNNLVTSKQVAEYIAKLKG